MANGRLLVGSLGRDDILPVLRGSDRDDDHTHCTLVQYAIGEAKHETDRVSHDQFT